MHLILKIFFKDVKFYDTYAFHELKLLQERLTSIFYSKSYEKYYLQTFLYNTFLGDLNSSFYGDSSACTLCTCK